MYPGDRRSHIPPNLYCVLTQRKFSPSLRQLLVLSRLSGYRLADWLAVFGIPLDDIPRLQASLPSAYTTLVDANACGAQSWFISFEQAPAGVPPESLRPLREWVRLGAPRQSDGPGKTGASFLYAKIGCQDNFAYPDLLPGSIVRIVRPDAPSFPNFPMHRRGAFFLVEHARGFTCSRLHVSRKNRIVLCPTLLPFAQIEFELGKEARILGVVDFELRPADFRSPSRVPLRLFEFWTPGPVELLSARLPFGRLLRHARQRSGLSFREASAKSARVAQALRDHRFFCATGSLSDFESNPAPPRSAHKLFSLSILYSLNFRELMSAGGLDPAAEGRDAMPTEFLTGHAIPRNANPESQNRPVLAQFPYSLGRAAAELFRMNHLSIRDLFSVGRQQRPFHPYLADAVAVVVDRRKKRIVTLRHAPLWAQPLYVLLQRDGQYVCTSCVSNGKELVLRPFSDGFDRPLRHKNPAEIEVIGRVKGILRRTIHERQV